MSLILLIHIIFYIGCTICFSFSFYNVFHCVRFLCSRHLAILPAASVLLNLEKEYINTVIKLTAYLSHIICFKKLIQNCKYRLSNRRYT